MSFVEHKMIRRWNLTFVMISRFYMQCGKGKKNWLNKFLLQYYIIVRIKLFWKKKVRCNKNEYYYWNIFLIFLVNIDLFISIFPLFYSSRHNRLILTSNILRLRKEALQMHFTARWLKWTVFSGFVWCCVLQLRYLA